MNQQNKIDELKDTMERIINDNMYYILDEDDSRYLAEGLIEAGYRKSTDVVREIFNDLNEMWHKGRGFINYSDLVKLERLHEQKYTESEDTK